MHEHVEEAEATPAAPAAPARVLAPMAAGPVAQVLALQRTAGNRAVNRVLARRENVQEVAVSEYIQEDLVSKSDKGETSVHWTAKFDAEIFDDRIVGHVKIRTYPDSDLDYETAREMRISAMDEFQRLFNDKFVIEEEVDWAFNPKRKLWLGVDFVTDMSDDRAEHLSVALHSGRGKDNRTNWYAGSPAIVRAHEIGHAFGLLDEYVDTNVQNRCHSGSSGVHEDNSIMGDYPNEGVDKATMKPRHALRIAKIIFKAAGKGGAKLTVHKR